jgi:signal transduction histidine kinase
LTRLVVVAVAAVGLILFVAFVAARLIQSRTRGLSIRMQFFLALSLIVGAFAFGLGLLVIDRIEARAVNVATQAATDEAATIAGLVAADMDRTGHSIHSVARRLEQEAARGADLRLQLLDAEGHTLFPEGGAPQTDEGIVRVDAPVRVRGRIVGAVRVLKPTVVMRRMLTDFAPSVLVTGLVLAAAAAMAAAWIGAAIARPIEALSRFAERVSGGERAAPPPPFGSREVQRLVRSFSSMRRQLEGRPFVETFAADLSHELKNPVAAIRAAAEVLDEGAIEEPDTARRFVQRIREATQRIEKLLGDLLSLARIEARGVESFDAVDLARIVRTAHASLLEGADRVQVSVQGDTRIRGDASWLGRTVTNLLENALVHGQPGPVHVSLEADGRRVRLSVKNAGRLAPHVRRRLFRRFVTTRQDRGGSGLGLAIVRAVTEAHGGQAALVSEGPPVVEFALTWPAFARHDALEASDSAERSPGSSPESSVNRPLS